MKTSKKRITIPKLNTLHLKIIALLSMTIDHLSYALGRQGTINATMYGIGRSIGRLAFPIYVYLLLIGFFKTHNKVKYALRLFLFALISEIPLDYFHNGITMDFAYQNVFFELLAIFFVYLCFDEIDKRKHWHVAFQGLLKAFTMVSVGFWTTICHFDYAWFGIAIGVTLYTAYQSRKNKTICGFIMLLGFILTIPFEMLFNPFSVLILAVIPLLLLCDDTKRIKQPKIVQFGFYAYYPIHLLLLGVIFR